MPGVGTTHHVKIGDIYAMCSPGGYRKRQAPLRGARISTGDPSYSDLSVWQVWVQHCWAGGLGADKWVDDSMFDAGVGIDSTRHEQASLSRDLVLVDDLNANSLGVAREFLVYAKPDANKRLYCITKPTSGSASSYLWRYIQGTPGSWELVKTFSGIQATCIIKHSGELAVGFSNGKIKSAVNPDADWSNRNPPKGETVGVSAMATYRQRLYVAYGRTVYRRKWNWKVDGKTEFYDPQTGGAIVCMENHLGFLYMGSKGGHIHRTDGNNTFDLWSWDGGTEVISMRSFDGRLFIGTYEFTDDDTLGVGGIYQMTGSAVTQLKKWGELDRSTITGKFREYDRKLFYGASALWSMNKTAAGTDLGGFGIAVYDPIEDAHSIWATNKDTDTYPDGSGTGADWIVDDVIYFNGKLHACVRGEGNFRANVSYRDYIEGTVNYDTTDTSATGSANNGFLVSSTYDGGTPGLPKLWRLGQVEGFFPSVDVDISLQYSIDDGDSWVTLGTLERTLTGTMVTATASPDVVGTGTAFLTELEPGDVIDIQGTEVTVGSIESNTAFTATANVGANESGTAFHVKERLTRKWYMSGASSEVVSPRLRYRVILNSESGTVTPTLNSVTFWYLPEPEPNWVWDLRLWQAERVELLDGTDDTQDMDDFRVTLEAYFRQQNVITFTDIDGSTYDALLWDYVYDHHVIGKADEPEEGFLAISILEVAD